MFYNFTIFKPENVKAGFRSEKIIVRMSENKISVLKGTDCIDFCRVGW